MFHFPFFVFLMWEEGQIYSMRDQNEPNSIVLEQIVWNLGNPDRSDVPVGTGGTVLAHCYLTAIKQSPHSHLECQ
jgi:hypothetical protein